MKTKMYNQNAQIIGQVDLPSRIFDAPLNPDLVHQVFLIQRSNSRRPVANAKDRGEVRGGGRKPWRQKGTGRARHGSIRSPLWKGGGVTHGPTKQKNFSRKINKKMKRQAFFGVLSKKAAGGDVIVLKDFSPFGGKTKESAKFLDKLLKTGKKRPSTLIIIPSKDEKTTRSTRNLDNVKSIGIENLNLQDLLGHRFLIIPKDSLETLETIFK